MYVDGANGIGADKIKLLARLLSSVTVGCDENANHGHHHTLPYLNMHLFNDGKNPGDKLNHLVKVYNYTFKTWAWDFFLNLKIIFFFFKIEFK